MAIMKKPFLYYPMFLLRPYGHLFKKLDYKYIIRTVIFHDIKQHCWSQNLSFQSRWPRSLKENSEKKCTTITLHLIMNGKLVLAPSLPRLYSRADPDLCQIRFSIRAHSIISSIKKLFGQQSLANLCKKLIFKKLHHHMLF